MKKLTVAAALILLAPLAAMRGGPLDAFSFSSQLFGYTGDDTLGYEFNVNQAVDVTSLGMFDADAYFGNTSAGLSGSHEIGIWSTTGNLLASAVVASGTTDPLDGDFRYVSLGSNLLLNPGDYIIGAEVNDQVNYGQDGTVTNLTGVVSYLHPELGFQGGLSFPMYDLPQDAAGYFGPNFQFTLASAVPDSGGWPIDLLAGMSLVLVGVRCNRRLGAAAV